MKASTGVNTPATVIDSAPPSPTSLSPNDPQSTEEDDEDLPPTPWKQTCTLIHYPSRDAYTCNTVEPWAEGQEGKVRETIKTGISHDANPFHLLEEIHDTPHTSHRINISLTYLGLYPLLSLQSRWTSHLLAYQKSNLRKGYKRQTKRKLKILHALRKRGQRTATPHSISRILQQHTTRFLLSQKAHRRRTRRHLPLD